MNSIFFAFKALHIFERGEVAKDLVVLKYPTTCESEIYVSHVTYIVYNVNWKCPFFPSDVKSMSNLTNLGHCTYHDSYDETSSLFCSAIFIVIFTWRLYHFI